jgi:hypothetical protein
MSVKKGQITLFIIVGIVILLGISLFLYYRSLLFSRGEVVSEDLMPVKNYVEACLQKTAEDAVVKIGQQGGYTEFPEELNLNRAYIELIPYSRIRVPYWNYNGKDYIPSIESIQLQISDFIKKNIESCIDFSILSKDYSITPSDKQDVETIIGQDSIDISLNYPMTIITDSGSKQNKISEFHANLEVSLKRLHELGKKILDAENLYTYFENITIDWISMNPDIPLNGIQFHCRELKWRVEDVKKELQQMAYYNLPYVVVKNTNHPEFLAEDEVYESLKKYTIEDINNGDYPSQEAPADAYEYSHYLIDVRSKKTDLKAGFVYLPEWGMDMTVRPSENGIMRSNKQQGSEEFLSFMCLNVYHFTYDVVYPIEVVLRDDSAFNNKGYTFRYILPVMINHNQPDRNGFLNQELIMSAGRFVGECDQLKGEEYDIRALGIDEYGIANMELKDANISFDCYNFRCYLGKTKVDSGSYRLVTQLPSSCAHGFLIGEKSGYLSSREQILDSKDVDLILKKLKTFSFEVVMNKYNTLNNQIQGDELVQAPFSAVVEMQSIDEPKLYFRGQYPFDDKAEQKIINLIEQNGKYSVNIILLDEADGLIIGGYQGNWSTRYDSIANNKKIRFHALSYMPKPMNQEAEQNVLKFLSESTAYQDKLKPELVQ